MPLLGLGLHIGDSDPDTIVGPLIDGVLRTEAGQFLNLESGGFLKFDLPPFLITEADENLHTEAAEQILTD